MSFWFGPKPAFSSDIATLKKLNTAFYKDNLSHRISAVEILKAVKVDADGKPYSEAELKEMGKQMYHGYSLFTHASNISQQAPYKQEDFYILLNACLSEVSLLLDVFLIVFSQYLDILNTPFLDENSLSEKEQGYLWVARVHAEEIKFRIPLYHKELSVKQNVHGTFLHIAFIEKWHIDIGKLH